MPLELSWLIINFVFQSTLHDEKKMTRQATISVQGLHKRYGEVHAVRGVDFSINAGEFVALIGANGAGKTSLLSVLAGLLPASEGQVTIMGAKPGALKVRQACGAMLQSTALPDALKVHELLELFRSYYPAPQPMAELLKTTGLSDLQNRRYSALSGGQQRRVQFALALAGNPGILFLDEPTVGLDMDIRREFWATLQNLKVLGVTIVLTSHYLDEIEALADRLLIMKEGKLIADDPTAKIKRRVEHKTIICETSLDIPFLQSMDGVISVDQAGRLKTIATNNENGVLLTMLSKDPNLKDLLVESSSLENAISAMIGNTNGDSA